MNEDVSRVYIATKRCIGVATSLVVFAYMIAVFQDGGFTNPKQPQNIKQLHQLQSKYNMAKQHPAQITSDALKRFKKLGSFAREVSRGESEDVNSRVEAHRAMAKKTAKVPERQTFVYGEALTKALDNELDSLALRIGQMEEKTALYEHGTVDRAKASTTSEGNEGDPATPDFVEILGASTHPVDELMGVYVETLHNAGYYISRALHDGGGYASVRGSKGPQQFSVVIFSKDVFPTYPTVVYMKVSQEGYRSSLAGKDDDEEGDEDGGF